MPANPAVSEMHDASPLTVDQLNRMATDAFTAILADVFEHSPWVAQAAAAMRPFASIDELHAAMVLVVAQSSAQSQLQLLRAHPELAGRAALAGELTASSTGEQARAGLNALQPEELARIMQLNQAYLLRHGFPFIVCVGRHTKQSIMETFEHRLACATTDETATALDEVALIARLRLQALLARQDETAPTLNTFAAPKARRQ
jgi:2-oxo-4-hydroxy-4-carboxy-5-ureidoimidazoline decarboxylase